MADHILLRHRDIPELDQIQTYRHNGGFEAWKKVVTKMDPVDVTNEVRASGLRGRGGAGFPTGMKWSFIDGQNWPHYVVANADESEPGTFKDREIMESNPFQFLEGVAICAYAVKANDAYIYLRGEFWQIAHKLDMCIADMETAGVLGDRLFGTNTSLHLHTHLGAGAYICGEETALLNPLRASWVSRAYAHLFPRRLVYLASRPSSITSKLWPMYLSSSRVVLTGIKASARKKAPDRKYSACQVVLTVPVIMSFRLAPLFAS